MAKTLDKPPLYETDYVAWLDEQAAHLRAGRLHALDVENVVEEFEGLARSDRREIENRLDTLLLHLLKWDHQPAQRSKESRATVKEQRARIRRLLRDSASLKREVEPTCRDVYPDAVRGASIETGFDKSAFPRALPYTVDQIFERRLSAEDLPERPSTESDRE